MTSTSAETSPPPQYAEFGAQGPTPDDTRQAHPADGDDDLSGGANQARKKRKARSGEHVCDSYEGFLREREKNLKLRDDALNLRGSMIEKDATISRLKLKANALQIELKQLEDEKNAIISRLMIDQKTREDTLVAAHVDKIEKMQNELLRAKLGENEARKRINDYMLEKVELGKQYKALEDQLNHLRQSFTHAPPADYEQSLIPDPNPNIRNHKEYKHPEAPKASKRYMHYNAPIPHPPNEGKIYVSRYGSNKYWDLGLCRAHFELGRTCGFEHCGLRHTPLTADEQIYMGRLEPEGSKFVRAVRQANLGRLEKVLL